MKTIGNILWFVFVGIFSFVYFYIVGFLLCITIIGIPFGKQCFKLGKLVLAPFKKGISTNYLSHPIANIIWAIIFGWEYACYLLVVSLILMITIIGIPFAKQCLKLAFLGFMPFGAKVK